MEQKNSREQVRLKELAAEYLGLGYEVLVCPQADQLPVFLQSVQPDMLAKKGDENIVFEVRSTVNLTGESLQKIARALEGRPGWRFELVLTNQRESSQFGEHYKSLTTTQLKNVLKDSKKHLKEGHDQYAAILAWIVVEGSLTLGISERFSLQNTGRSPKRLIKEAVSLGLISQEDFPLLESLAEFRNRFVHAMQTQIPSADEISRSLNLAHVLLEKFSRQDS